MYISRNLRIVELLIWQTSIIYQDKRNKRKEEEDSRITVKNKTFDCSWTACSTVQQAEDQGYQSTQFGSETHKNNHDMSLGKFSIGNY